METENICYWMYFHALPYTSIGYVEKTTLRMQYTVHCTVSWVQKNASFKIRIKIPSIRCLPNKHKAVVLNLTYGFKQCCNRSIFAPHSLTKYLPVV
jgi:hypothetical protein